MSPAMERGARWRRRKLCKSTPAVVAASDDDCGSLTWLLSFRLEGLVAPGVAPDEELEPEVEAPPKRTMPTLSSFIESPRKPPYTYPELIEGALRERGELTVSGIYQWISDRFPYFKANDERWKNSVRHNLSINPYFRKGGRAPQGAGHLWSLAANAIDLLPLRYTYPSGGQETNSTSHVSSIDDKLELLPLRNHYPSVIVLDEAAIAAASIMPDNDYECAVTATAFLNPVSIEQVVLESGLLSVD